MHGKLRVYARRQQDGGHPAVAVWQVIKGTELTVFFGRRELN
jgi:hypothetical protein